MDTTKEAYKAKMEAQLDLWSARLDGFKATLAKATAEARVQLVKQMGELETLQTSARSHIASVETSAAESWHKARGGIEEKWNQLTGSVEAVLAKISPDPANQN